MSIGDVYLHYQKNELVKITDIIPSAVDPGLTVILFRKVFIDIFYIDGQDPDVEFEYYKHDNFKHYLEPEDFKKLYEYFEIEPAIAARIKAGVFDKDNLRR